MFEYSIVWLYFYNFQLGEEKKVLFLIDWSLARLCEFKFTEMKWQVKVQVLEKDIIVILAGNAPWMKTDGAVITGVGNL